MSFERNCSNKCRKQLLDTGLDTSKTASKKVIHKAAEETSESIGIKRCTIVKQTLVIDESSRNVKEIIIPPERREEMLNELDKY